MLRRVPPWVACLLVALTFVGWDAVRRVRHIREISATYGVTVDAPDLDAQSPTGYRDGRRSLILPDRSMDGYHWIMQTQAMLAAGEWRVRHADYDNSPGGRAIHWAQPFRWYLVALAAVDHVATSDSMAIALERSSLWSGPILLGAVMIVVTVVAARRFSVAAAALLAPAVVAAFPLYVDFEAGYVDHHGLVNTCALLGVLCLVVPRPGDARARSWLLAGAVAAGVGLWISAATEVIVLAGVGIAAAVSVGIARGTPGAVGAFERPESYRLWGLAGASVSVAAYLIEYFPAHMGLHLEVNHPLYALAWAAGGEALCRWARIMNQAARRPPDVAALLVAIAGVAVVPAVIVATASTSFVVADPFLWRLHRDFISEFQSLPSFLSSNGYNWRAVAYCWPLLLLGPLLWRLVRPAVPAGERASLALAAIPALFTLPFAWGQVRWWSLELALLLPALAAWLRAPRSAPAHSRRAALVAIGAALLFLPGAMAAVQHALHSTELTEDDIRDLAARDVAHWLRQRAGTADVNVAGSPTITTALIFHGSLRGLGTLYWENRDGLKAAADLYAARDDASARAIVRQHGITHIVVVTWDGFEGVYVRMARGLPASAALPADSFIARLLTAPEPPLWLRALAFPLPPHPALAGQQVRIYEVTPDQSPVLGLVRAADFFVTSGRLDEVEAMVPYLAAQRTDLAAQTMVAEIAWRRHDGPALREAAARVRLLLPAARDLPFEEHARLVEVLLASGDEAGVRTQLPACLAKANETEIRRLDATRLAGLLKLSDAAGVTWPDPALRRLASSLLPPPLQAAIR
ncbi:MAG TPA: hypothetical protein VG936_04730 [Lacunisphaera sp.]|nr:hypothetical protein [Lacunisphaera sp.]